MKKKSLIAAALVAAGIVSQASAHDAVVYLTGSTAFRSQVYTALHGSGYGIFTATPDYEADYGNSLASKCNYMLFHGTVGTTPVYINCAWSGSDAGMG